MARLATESPARVIGLSHRSLTGRVVVKGTAVPFESSLERDLLVVLDFDTNVERVREQPVRISYRGPDGGSRSYVPDFQAARFDGSSVLYEVKYRDELKAEWPRLRPRFRAAVAYAREHGMRFSIMTDVEIRGPHLRNIAFLRQYRDRMREPAVEEHLVRTLAILGETTPDALIAAAYWTAENRMRAIGSLWRMVALRRIQADLFKPLTMKTPIWVPIGEGFL